MVWCLAQTILATLVGSVKIQEAVRSILVEGGSARDDDLVAAAREKVMGVDSMLRLLDRPLDPEFRKFLKVSDTSDTFADDLLPLTCWACFVFFF